MANKRHSRFTPKTPVGMPTETFIQWWHRLRRVNIAEPHVYAEQTLPIRFDEQFTTLVTPRGKAQCYSWEEIMRKCFLLAWWLKKSYASLTECINDQTCPSRMKAELLNISRSKHKGTARKQISSCVKRRCCIGCMQSNILDPYSICIWLEQIRPNTLAMRMRCTAYLIHFIDSHSRTCRSFKLCQADPIRWCMWMWVNENL